MVMRDDGRLALSRLYGIAESVARLRQQSRDVLMVSSGAVGLGMERIGMPSGLPSCRRFRPAPPSVRAA